jgi:hypothetical protein
MGDEISHPTGRWARHAHAPGTDKTVRVGTQVVRDGRSWSLGTAGDVEWIAAGTTIGKTITSAIPARFDAYATIVRPKPGEDQAGHDEAVLSVLREHPTCGAWWLGYLDTGADDVVFPNAPRVSLYAGWPYVLVQAGPEQAARWRGVRPGSFWSGHAPNLIFPTDHGWLVSTLWDDDWTCVGGTVALVENLINHPELRARSRRVVPGEDATPPGHHAV